MDPRAQHSLLLYDEQGVALTLCHCTNNLCRLWLVIWTVNNIGVTLLNKAAFQSVDFNYPYFLSAVHMICNAAGSQLIFWSLDRARASGDKAAVESNPVTQLLGTIQRQTLDPKGRRLILAFSVIFSLNIAIGNVSLKYVSVNFNQVCVDSEHEKSSEIVLRSTWLTPPSYARQLDRS